jgi:hypothetical protein
MPENPRTSGSSGSINPPTNPPPPPPPPNPPKAGPGSTDDKADQPFGDLIGRKTCPPGYSLAGDGKCYRNEVFTKTGGLRKIPGGEN